MVSKEYTNLFTCLLYCVFAEEEKADGDSEDEEDEEDQITEVRFVPEDATVCELPCDQEIKVNGEIFLAVLLV